MNGIPVPIQIDGEQETVYLATRRSGEPGAAMREAKMVYHCQQMHASHCLQEVALCGVQVDKLHPKARNFGERLDELNKRQGAAASRMQEYKQAALDAAERLVRLSLEENYGPAADRYLNVLTDAQLAQLVGVIESGEVPEDFFPARATPPSGSGMSASGAGAGARCSNAGSGAGTSKAARSGSRTRTSSGNRKRS